MFERHRPRATAVLVIALVAVCAIAVSAHAQLDQPPTVEIDNPNNGTIVEGEVNVTGNASSLDGEVERVEVRIDEGEWREANGTERWNVTWETTLWTSGPHNVTARSWDGDQYSENETVNVTVDQPPTVSILGPEENATVGGQVNVTGSTEDLEGSVEHVQVRVDEGPWRNATLDDGWWLHWDTTQLPSGDHNVTARASDGNWTRADTVNVTVDQPPSVDVEEPSAGATVEGNVSVNGTAADREDGLEQVEVRVDGGPWQAAEGTTDWSLEWDTTAVPDGDHRLTVRADDGNQTTTETVNVTVQNEAPAPDDGPPSVSIEHPEEGARVNGTVTVEGHADASGDTVERVEVRVDDSDWAQAELQEAGGAVEWRIPWDTTAVPDGTHTLTVRADDGNATATQSVDVTVENERDPASDGPVVAIAAPSDGEVVSGTVTFEGSAQAPQGSIERVQLRVGDGPWQDAGGTSNWTLEWDATSVEDGPRNVVVNATDERGAHAQASIGILVSNEDEPLEPTAESQGEELKLSIEQPSSGASVSEELTVVGVLQSPEAASPVVEYRIDQGSWNEVMVPSNEAFEHTIDVSHLEGGEHTLHLRAVDADGASQEESVTFTVEESMVPVPGPGPGLLLASLAAVLAVTSRGRRST